jgi:hypothetical protein
LSELVVALVAGHHPDLRDRALSELMTLAREVVLKCERRIFPDGWLATMRRVASIPLAGIGERE